MLEIYNNQILCSLARFCNSWLWNSLLDKLLPPTFFFGISRIIAEWNLFGKICFHFLYWRTCKDWFFLINGSIVNFGYKFPSFVCLWNFFILHCILIPTLIFLSKSWKLNWKNFVFFIWSRSWLAGVENQQTVEQTF